MMTEEKNLILTESQIVQKIKRIAFEIYENNFAEDSLVLIGIHEAGFEIAKEIQCELSAICPADTDLYAVHIDKFNAHSSEVTFQPNIPDLTDCSVLVIDDVLNTGKTLAFVLKKILDFDVKKAETAVLVNRSHKLFPISADYTGLELSTTINEHIRVTFARDKKGVYLY